MENEAEEQLAFADRVLLNKTDLVTEETELKKIEDRIRKINPNAPIIRCQQSKVDWKKIIGLGAGGAATIAISEDVSEPRAGKGNSALAKARCRGRGEGGAEDARRRASIGRVGDALVNARAAVRWSGRAPARRETRGGNHRNPLFPSLPLASTYR